MNLSRELLRFHDPLVRDLAWALLSPPLVRDRTEGLSWMTADWCREQYEVYLPRLHQLDRHPEVLHTHVNTGADRRLGAWFESLLSFWLGDPCNERYCLLKRGLKVNDEDRTLGELDFIVRDNQTHQIEHWEVAVKFYLGHAPGHHTGNWIGPSLRDRLDRKIKRLRDHQMPMHQHPLCQELLRAEGWEVKTSRAIVKGRLFYPRHRRCDTPGEVASSHLKGWWVPVEHLKEYWPDGDLRWLPMPMTSWLSPLLPSDLEHASVFDTSGIIEWLGSAFHNRPLAILGYSPEGIEIQRLFVAPKGWENQFE